MFRYKVELSAIAQVSQNQYIDSEVELTAEEIQKIALTQYNDYSWDYEDIEDNSIEVHNTELWLKL